jgi:RNA 2',3'-cyclic 3'-phosphodiesterase
LTEEFRCFVAIELPLGVIQTLAVVRQDIEQLAKSTHSSQELAASVRWVRPEGSHLTLKFLGQAPVGQIPAIGQSLMTAGTGAGPLNLTLAGIGAFPNLRRARVLWVGIAGDVSAIADLYSAIERELAILGYPAETRAFHPHLTLARLETGLPEAMVRSLSANPPAVPPAPFRAIALSLMRSELRPEGASYTQLATIPLGR